MPNLFNLIAQIGLSKSQIIWMTIGAASGELIAVFATLVSVDFFRWFAAYPTLATVASCGIGMAFGFVYGSGSGTIGGTSDVGATNDHLLH